MKTELIQLIEVGGFEDHPTRLRQERWEYTSGRVEWLIFVSVWNHDDQRYLPTIHVLAENQRNSNAILNQLSKGRIYS